MVQASRVVGATDSVTLCPITTEIFVHSKFRTRLDPDPENGLNHPSTVMIDKILTVPTDRIHSIIGQIDADAEGAISAALRRWLDL